MGFPNFWIGIFSVDLIVVTSHDAFVDCWLFNVPFRVFAMIVPFLSSKRWVFISEILCWWPCTFVRGMSVCLSVSVSCVNHDVKVEMFYLYVLVFILNENKWYNLTVLFPNGWDQDFVGIGGRELIFRLSHLSRMIMVGTRWGASLWALYGLSPQNSMFLLDLDFFPLPTLFLMLLRPAVRRPQDIVRPAIAALTVRSAIVAHKCGMPLWRSQWGLP